MGDTLHQQLSEDANESYWCNNHRRSQAVSDMTFAEDKEQLQLEFNESGIWECHGRIQGEYPVYLPDTALFTAKIVQRAHLSTLHGGVGMVMAKFREKYWVPKLRKLAWKESDFHLLWMQEIQSSTRDSTSRWSIAEMQNRALIPGYWSGFRWPREISLYDK
jgi:hypothetical protein